MLASVGRVVGEATPDGALYGSAGDVSITSEPNGASGL